MSPMCSGYSLAAAALLVVFSVPGCGGVPRTYPVEGKVEMAPAALKKLVEKEATVYLQSDSDPTVQASGKLEADGSFKLSTTYQGKPLKGAQAGAYSACILWEDHPEAEQKSDDEPAVDPPLAKSIIPYRYLTFHRSGWKVTVPSDAPVVLKVAAK